MLAKRIITAVILAPIMAAGIFFLPLPQFAAFIGFITLLGAWEWSNLAGVSSLLGRAAYTGAIAVLLAGLYWLQLSVPDVGYYVLWIGLAWWLLAFYFVSTYPKSIGVWQPQVMQLVMGGLVLIPMWVGFYFLKQFPNSSLWIILLMLFIWGADVGAYFAGRLFGESKLAPNVSPGKTWAGVVGGLITVYLVAILAGLFFAPGEGFNATNWLSFLFAATVVSAVSIIGDLVESMVKRNRGVKDSSNLLPGHGGVLDRADSMCAAVPVFALALSILPIA